MLSLATGFLSYFRGRWHHMETKQLFLCPFWSRPFNDWMLIWPTISRFCHGQGKTDTERKRLRQIAKEGWGGVAWRVMTEAFGIQRTEEYCVPVGHCGTDCFFTGWSRYWSHKKSFWRRSVRYTCTNHPPESKIPHTNGLQIKIYRQRILTNILCLKGQS